VRPVATAKNGIRLPYSRIDEVGDGGFSDADASSRHVVARNRTTVAYVLAKRASSRRRNATASGPGSSLFKATGRRYACDFFGVEVLGVFGTVRHLVFFVIGPRIVLEDLDAARADA
jgi:hypothetical protein